MIIKLFSRFLSLDNQGQGRVTLDIYNELKKDHTVLFNGLSSNHKHIIHYLLKSLIFKAFDFRRCDYNLAITPTDTFWLNPKKSIVIIHDLIPLISTFEVKTHYNKSFISKFLTMILFYFSLKSSFT